MERKTSSKFRRNDREFEIAHDNTGVYITELRIDETVQERYRFDWYEVFEILTGESQAPDILMNL